MLLGWLVLGRLGPELRSCIARSCRQVCKSCMGHPCMQVPSMQLAAHLAKGALPDDADRAQLRPLNLPLVGLSSKHGALLRAVGRAGVVRSINCMRSVDQAAGRFASTAAPGGGWKGWQAELSRGGTSQQHCNAAHSWRNPAAACRTSNMHSRHSRCSRQSRHSSSPRRHPRFRAQAGSPPPGLTGTPGC